MFSADGILTRLSLLMPTFSLLYSPQVLTILLHPVYNAPLPIVQVQFHSFGNKFEPR